MLTWHDPLSLLVLAAAYVFGSFPSGLVLARLVAGTDVRQVGSGNIGAANTARAAGVKVGVLVAVLDVLKGMLPVLLGRWLGLDAAALAAAAGAAVLGHDFTIFLRFRGGKGVATTLGVALALAPAAAALSVAAFVILVLIWRYTSVASLSALALLPVLMAFTRQPAAYVVLAVLLFVLAVAKHWENIIRLMNGTEPRFRSRPEPSDDARPA